MATGQSQRTSDGLMQFDIDLTEFSGGPSIQVITDQKGSGRITTDMKESCPCCGETECYADCDGSQMDEAAADAAGVAYESEEDQEGRKLFNAAVDGMEALILGAASAGVDISSAAFVEGIETAYSALGNNF